MRTVTWSRCELTPSTAWGMTARSRCTARCVSGSTCCRGETGGMSHAPCRYVHGFPLGNRVLLDLLLQLHDPVEHGFGDRRATRDINVHRHHFVNALHYRISREGAAGAGAVAHGDAPLRLGHLVPNGAHD